MRTILSWGCSVLVLFAGEARAATGPAAGPATKPAGKTGVARSASPRARVAGLADTNLALRLPALDLDEIRAEDARQAGPGKPLRIGLVRDLPLPVAATAAPGAPGGWEALPDGGRVWRLSVEAPGAIGVRIHLSGLALPPGCEILAYATRDPAKVRGPYSAETLGGRNRFWTGTVFADDVTVECHCPAGVSPEQIGLTADRVVHIYRDPAAPRKEGGCHNDVSCDPAWTTVANGVAGIGTIGRAGYIWCTGCLLNDQDPATFIDYFVTANHCVADQGEADDTEFYWFYQTGGCDQAPPSISAIPTTDGGATYLAGRTYEAGNDFAFLRLRKPSPGGVTYAGWSVQAPGPSETLTGIHHPDGAYKRISYGMLDSSDLDFWNVRWLSGVTEPGSSGSPLFDAGRNFIGQLFGGYSSCGNPGGIDFYGRFDATYPRISKWLLGAPTLTASPARRLVGRRGGRTTFTISKRGSGTMSYQVSEASTWLRILSGSRGTDSGRVTIYCEPNAGWNRRTGTITIRSSDALDSPKTVRIVQGGRRSPLLGVAPERRTVGAAAGRTRFSVANLGGGTLTYRASESAGWLRIERGGRGTNRGTVTLYHARNPSTRARTGTVVVAASGVAYSPARVKIVQAGQAN